MRMNKKSVNLFLVVGILLVLSFSIVSLPLSKSHRLYRYNLYLKVQEVPHFEHEKMNEKSRLESESLRKRVIMAREIQKERFRNHPDVKFNPTTRRYE